MKRFPYREVQGHPFFSLTFEARKPETTEEILVMYRGPLAALVTHQGDLLPVGEVRRVNRGDLPADDGDFFIFDEAGRALNVPQDSWSCCPPTASQEDGAGACCPSPEDATHFTVVQASNPSQTAAALRHYSGCMVCGAPLVYREEENPDKCHYCRTILPTNVACENGHFVCDACHTTDALAVIEHICQTTRETDLIVLLEKIRQHPAISRHGPEHHVLVPAVILATYRNLGGEVTPKMFSTALKWGKAVPGGTCGFWGVCGAAAGVGIAFSVLLKANPVKPGERRQVQSVVHAVLGELAAFEAARCCQRECWLALRKAAELSRELLPIPLRAEAPLICRQSHDNRDCLLTTCPLWDGHVITKANQGS